MSTTVDITESTSSVDAVEESLTIDITEATTLIDIPEENVTVAVVDEVVNISVVEETISIDVTEEVVNITITDESGYVLTKAAVEAVLIGEITSHTHPNSGSVTYTGTAERNVGGITDGQGFNDVPMAEMWDTLIKQEKFPTLTAPSSTFSSSHTGYHEIGEVIPTITFNAAFSRGSISPQYTATSPYRSGLPNQYTYTGGTLANQASTSLTDIQTESGYTVIANGQSWTCQVAYDAGVQPKSSYDNDYSTPLSAGSTSVDTQTITGVLPVYATDTIIGTLTKQSLQSNGSVFTVTVVAEDGVDKQTVDFTNDAALAWGTITKLEQYNTLSGLWDEISLSTFTSSSTTHTIQSVSRDYTRYTHNGATIGERQLRWTV